MKKLMKSGKIIKKLLIIISILLIAFVLEISINDLPIRNYKNIPIDKNNIEITLKPVSDISLDYEIKVKNINVYLDELNFDVYDQNRKIPFDVIITKKNIESFKKSEVVNQAFNKKNISINENISNIKLIFHLNANERITIKNINIDNSFSFNVFRYIFISICLYFIFNVSLTIYKKEDFILPNEFLKISLIFGIGMLLFNPIYFSWDEREHFVKSYNLASGNVIMREKEMIKWPENSDKFLITGYDVRTYSTFNDFKYQFKELDKLTSQGYSLQYYHSTAITYTFIPYIFSGFGILIAKMLGASLIIQFYAGRLFNLIIYSIVCFFALKKCKNFQSILFFLALLPVALFQACSYSADVTTNAFAILSVALILNEIFNAKKTNNVNILMILLSCSFVTISKIAYFPIFLLIMLIPKEKYKNKLSKNVIRLISLFLSIGLFVGGYLYANSMGLTQWIVTGVDVKQQFFYIVTSPINYIFTIFNTFNSSTIGYMQQFTVNLAYCGGIGDIPFVIILFILFIVSANKNICSLNFKQKLVILMVVLLCIGATMSTLYLTFTPIKAEHISGFQGRYLIPIMPLLALLLNNTFNLNIDNIKMNKYLTIAIIIFGVLSLYLMITNFYL